MVGSDGKIKSGQRLTVQGTGQRPTAESIYSWGQKVLNLGGVT